jgi:hypothetical protein
VGPFGSTSTGPPGERKAALRQAAARVLSRGQRLLPREELVALLFPMVSRAVRTDRGPAALVRWLRHRTGGPRAGHRTEHAARRLTEDLVRALSESPGGRGDTLADSRLEKSHVAKS